MQAIKSARFSPPLPVKLLFQDEARFGRIQDPRRCWAPTRLRPYVNYQIIREFIYALAAVSPQKGELTSLVMPWIDSVTMSIFLAHVAHTYPDNFLIMLLDKAGWHNAKNLKVPERMKLIFLPPYSPQLNPVEHIWDHLRENYFSNKTFNSLDEVENVLCKGLNDLFNSPETVRSLTNFNWFNTLCLT